MEPCAALRRALHSGRSGRPHPQLVAAPLRHCTDVGQWQRLWLRPRHAGHVRVRHLRARGGDGRTGVCAAPSHAGRTERIRGSETVHAPAGTPVLLRPHFALRRRGAPGRGVHAPAAAAPARSARAPRTAACAGGAKASSPPLRSCRFWRSCAPRICPGPAATM